MAGKKFQFSLATVLRFRRHEADRARQALAHIIEARKQQEARLAEVRSRLQEVHAAAPIAGSADPMAFRRFSSYRTHLERACDRELRSLEDARRSEARARERLLEKRREEESLQSLHDEKKSRHRLEEQGAETDFLDEQALLGYLGKHRPARP